MKQILLLVDKSLNQITKNYKKLLPVYIAVIAFDLIDLAIQEGLKSLTRFHFLQSLYPLISLLISIFLALWIYQTLIDIALKKKIDITFKLYLTYLWTGIMVVAVTVFGSIFLLIPGLLWLLFNTYTQVIVVSEPIGAKDSIAKSIKLVSKNLKETIYLASVAVAISMPLISYIGYTMVKAFSGNAVYNFVSVGSIFSVFYGLFVGLLMGLTTLNLYEKLNKGK